MTHKLLFSTLVAALLMITQGTATADYYDGLRAFDQGDQKTAVREWTAAAQQGDVKAMFKMGRLHEQGQGVVQNFINSHAYYNLATANGHADAMAAREAIAAKMTPDELASARSLAASWQSAPATTAKKPAKPIANTTSVSRFDGMWQWSLVEERSQCDLAFGPPVELKDGRYKGRISSLLDIGISTMSGKVDATGKVKGFVAGNFVSVNVSGQLDGDTGQGKAEVSGEMVCIEYWKATRVSSQ